MASTVSPKVNWKVTNNNVLVATPLNGVTAVVAATTSGEVANPDEVITSVRRFRELYGSEVVPDGSVSNIETALTNGSKLRVSRVAYSPTVALEASTFYGTSNSLLSSDNGDGNLLVPSGSASDMFFEGPVYKIYNKNASDGYIMFSLKLRVNEKYIDYAGYFGDNPLNLTGANYDATMAHGIDWPLITSGSESEITSVYNHLTLFASRKLADLENEYLSSAIIPTSIMATMRNYETTSSTHPYACYMQLSTIMESSHIAGTSPEMLTYYPMTGDLGTIEKTGTFSSFTGTTYGELETFLVDSGVMVNDGNYHMFDTNNTGYMIAAMYDRNTEIGFTREGGKWAYMANLYTASIDGSMTMEGAPGVNEFSVAIEAFRNYDEPYQMIISSLEQFVPINMAEDASTSSDYATIYKQALNLVQAKQDCSLFVGIPKYAYYAGEAYPSTVHPEYFDMISFKNMLSQYLGQSEFVSYFAQGVYISDPDTGTVSYSDGMGMIVALADTAASEYGPWYHFSGANRGIVTNATKLGYPNYGLKGNAEYADLLAADRICLFVQKRTRTSDNPLIMLWHNFTDISTTNSQRFLGVQRLTYYVNKNITPILESYLEEPNTFSTWDRIYLDVKRVLDYLITNLAITEYEWQGDQGLNSYDDLQVNNETDVRNGIYKVNLVVKEVVAMQEINFEFIIKASDGTVTATVS